jgi:iron complex transport system substrate-binding protein
MNGDGKLTSVDALIILQAAAGNMHYPRTIVDSNGDEITIYKPVERIIAYNSDGAEVIQSLGATGDVVGVGTVVAEDDFVPEFAEVPTVGKWNSPNCEMIIALNPDIVLVYGKWPEKGKLEDKLRGGSTSTFLRI